MRPIVNVYKLGRTPYIKALNVQNVLFDNLKRIVTSPTPGHSNLTATQNNEQPDVICQRIGSILQSTTATASQSSRCLSDLPVTNSLVLVEHEPVYTVGLRAQLYNQDYVAKLKLKLAENNLVADFVQTNRGGLITFHGPGQLVAYPILYLGDFSRSVPNKSVKAYVKKLEQSIIDCLDLVGLPGAHTIREYPGVWLAGGERKIAFVGITCKRYVTMHGISINCDCDLSWFDHIVSCGIEDKLITSVRHELVSNMNQGGIPNGKGSSPSDLHGDGRKDILQPSDGVGFTNSSVQNMANAFCSSFSRHFDCELRER